MILIFQIACSNPAFQQRRKQVLKAILNAPFLKNQNLPHLPFLKQIDKSLLQKAFILANIDPRERAENLNYQNYLDLANRYLELVLPH